MKAQTVYENINFERGQDPKEKMRIGQVSSYIYNIVKLLTEDMTKDKVEYKVKEEASTYEGFYKLIQI